MANPSFVLSAYTAKDETVKRQVNFRQTKLRYLVVAIACLVVFGCQYCFDNPSALQSQIQQNYKQKQGSKLGQAQFNLLYSLYSFPNIVIPLLGGILIDKKGPRLVIILTAFICVLGQTVFTVGGFKNIFGIMLAGRALFGVGGQVLHASQNTLISKWFKASQLSLVLGICISFPKLGSAVNAALSPAVAQKYQQKKEGNYQNVGVPLLIGLGLMILSLMFALLLAYIDRRSAQKQKIEHESLILSRKSKPKSMFGFEGNPKSVFVEEGNSRSTLQANTKGEGEGEGHIDFKAIKNLPITFWFLLLVAMLSEALFIPFLDNGNKYFVTIFKSIKSSDEAGIYLILPYVVSSILVPPMGYIVDKIKNRGQVLIVSCIFIFLTYTFMMAMETSSTLRQSGIVAWIPVVLLGVCVAIFCTVVVPTVPMILSPKLFGTGFGMMEMLQNLGLSVFPLISGAIRETKPDSELKGFHRQTLFFFIVSCLCLGICIILYGLDYGRGKKLHRQDFRLTYVKKHMKD